MPPPAIRVRNLSKKYQIGAREARPTSFREALTGALASPFRRFQNLRGTSSQAETFWALKDVSFDIEEGEVVGVIGRNGAGKSTLLKILSQITEPTSGEVELHGRVGSLLEVGTGFHPELSGRENIYLNGAILGMKREEITKRFDEIVAFAEVDKFLDTPVKRYSSGMYVRLAFAVAAHLQPEILIVDEVLAVGDAAFQKKCLGRMSHAAESGMTVLFVSHDLAAIRRICSRAVLLSKGNVEVDGPAQATVDSYFLSQFKNATALVVPKTQPRIGSGAAKILSLSFAEANRQVSSPQTGHFSRFEFKYESTVRDKRAHFAFGIISLSGEYCLHCSTFTLDRPVVLCESGSIICEFSRLPLLPGTYFVNIKLDDERGQTIDYVQNAFSFSVLEGDYYRSGRLPNAANGHVLTEYEFLTKTAC